MRTLAIAATAVLLGAGIASAAPIDNIGADGYRHPKLPTTPCPVEDSNRECYWDSGNRGDGHGHSFWVLHINGKVCVRYLDPRIDGYCQ